MARVARILGEKVVAAGLIGGGTGEFINNQLQKDGIISKFVPINGETRICINILDEKIGTSTEVLEPGPAVTSDEYRIF